MHFEEMKQEVFAQKPHFGAFVREWGGQTWPRYYAEAHSSLSTTSVAPSEDVLAAIQHETEKILGVGTGSSARQSVASQRWTDTAAHHGLLCHPYFYAATLARSHTLVRKEALATVTLPFGGVSLSNDSFPRGFFFHDSQGEEVRVFFKSLQERRLPVFALLPMSREHLAHERERMPSSALAPHARERLDALFAAFLASDRVWSQPTYSAQLTVLNSILWRELFGESRGENVYLAIDSVVCRLLLEKHLCTDTLIQRLLFTPAWREAFVTLFSGVSGSHTENAGTHFFWYIDYAQKCRRGLVLLGDTLITREGDVQIPLTPEALASGLEKRTLMPSSALLLIILEGVEGLVCGGGSSQLEYLPVMLEKWSALATSFGETVHVPYAPIVCGHNALFEYGRVHARPPVIASLVDVLLYGSDISSTIDGALETITIEDSIDALIPILYQLYTGAVTTHSPFIPTSLVSL